MVVNPTRPSTGRSPVECWCISLTAEPGSMKDHEDTTSYNLLFDQEGETQQTRRVMLSVFTF